MVAHEKKPACRVQLVELLGTKHMQQSFRAQMNLGGAKALQVAMSEILEKRGAIDE